MPTPTSTFDIRHRTRSVPISSGALPKYETYKLISCAYLGSTWGWYGAYERIVSMKMRMINESYSTHYLPAPPTLRFPWTAIWLCGMAISISETVAGRARTG